MMKKQLASLFAIACLQPVCAMQNNENLDALLLGVRNDVVDPRYIQELLEKGAQLNARDHQGETALMKFARRSWYPECKLLIIHSRFDLDGASNQTITTLTQHKLNCLKPLMKEAMTLAKDDDLRTLLDPEKLEENFKDEIEKNIEEYLEPDYSAVYFILEAILGSIL